MAPFNLFLFLALALAGCVTIHLYRLDSDSDYGQTVPPMRRTVVRTRMPSQGQARFSDIRGSFRRRADSIAFFDIPSDAGMDSGSGARLLTDFLSGADSLPVARDEAGDGSRCA